jgi:tRNA nucleotidyltransferase/poly(A) polymerase
MDALIKHKGLIESVSVERINTELVKIIDNDNCYKGVWLLSHTGILDGFLKIDLQIRRSFINMQEPIRLETKLAILFNSRKNVDEVLQSLKFPKNTINKVLNILEAPDLIYKLPHMPLHWRKRFYASKHSLAQIEFYQCAHESLGLSKAALIYTERFRERLDTLILPKPLVDGNDLLAKGYKAGKEFSVILTKLYNLQLDGLLTTKDEAIGWLDVL